MSIARLSALIIVVLLLARPVYAHAQYVPGQSLSASCSGEWQAVSTSSTTISGECAALPQPSPPSPSGAIVVGHDEVALFDRVPVSLVQPLRVMSANWSVGFNISQGLTRCLAVNTASAPAFCKRWSHPDGSYAVTPMSWMAHPLPHWTYYAFMQSDFVPLLPCSDRSSDLACFESYVNASAHLWDVMSLQPSYLHAGGSIAASAYLAMYERLKARHPRVTFVLHTSSLARVVGHNPQAVTSFNTAIRAYVAQHGGVLLDIAEILSTDPFGQQWFYQGSPAITPYYTSETNGGHLGSPSAGMIRVAQGYWVLLGQIAGWRP